MELLISLGIGTGSVVTWWAWTGTEGHFIAKAKGVLSIYIISTLVLVTVWAIYTAVILGEKSVGEVIARFL